MAKRRILKKEISYAVSELFWDVLICRLYIPDVDQEKGDVVMARVLDMQDEYIRRANRPDGKDNKALVKAYYRKLRTDLQQEVDVIVKQIGELCKKKEGNEESN